MPARGAHGIGTVGIVKEHTPGSQFVKMGCEDLVVSITTHHARRLVVNEDQKDIGLARTHTYSSFGFIRLKLKRIL